MRGVQSDKHDRGGADQPYHDRIGSRDERGKHERDHDEAGKPESDQRREATPAGDADHHGGEEHPITSSGILRSKSENWYCAGWSAEGGIRTSLITWPTLTPEE